MDSFIKFIEQKQVYGPILTVIVAYIIYNIIKSSLYRIINKGKKSGYEEKRRKTVIVLITNFIKVFTCIIVILII